MYCKNCGHEIAKDAVFCAHCGEKVKTDADRMQGPASAGGRNQKGQTCERQTEPIVRYGENSRPAEKDRRKHPLGRVLGIVASVGIFLAAFLFCVGTLTDSPAQIIRDTYWEDYSDAISIGDAFEQNFRRGHWEDKTVGGEPCVWFFGEIPTSMGNVDVELYYDYDEENDMFYLNGAAVNGSETSYLTAQALMRYGYTGDWEALVTDLLAEGLLELIFSGI